MVFWVVSALVKLENLKAIHNGSRDFDRPFTVVIALVKLENLKAIHNTESTTMLPCIVVIALVKLENLKAIHNVNKCNYLFCRVVIALVKLENPNLLQHRSIIFHKIYSFCHSTIMNLYLCCPFRTETNNCHIGNTQYIAHFIVPSQHY